MRMSSRRAVRWSVMVGAAVLLAATRSAAGTAFTLFESGQVRPLALAPSGTRLFAVNTPDGRLEIFDVTATGLAPVGSVAVGLEPVAVAARSDAEVWVVNHLSDSVSVVDVADPGAARVVRTLLVGDEPRDIVFGGPRFDRAFVTTAHRGQNTPFQATIASILTTPGLGRADVWVFDAADPAPGPATILTLFGDTPRALAVTPDGTRVYVAIFNSGNRTTTIAEPLVPDGGAPTGGPSDCSAAPGGLPPPNTNFEEVAQPEVGLVVQFDGAHWRDELGRCWDSEVRFALPDHDVFAIDATVDPPVPVAGAGGVFDGVGTTLFNLAVNPATGAVYVSNLEAFNRVRFEGAGAWAAGFKPPGEPASVRGHLAESRITVLDGGTVRPRHLNKHVDYGACCAPLPNAENAASLAFPLGMAVSADGGTLYVAGFGSGEIGVYDTGELAADTFVPSPADQIPVSGGGPTGLALDEARERLYVLTRFDDGLSIISLATRREIGHVRLHDPEPPDVVAGRPFLYDAAATSSHGDSACASCHIFGDLDGLAWDLGDPGARSDFNPGPFALGPFVSSDFRPMKGPMTTQSLRGMANHGPMHWRGDRTGGRDVPPGASAQPDTGTFDEVAAFTKFNPAFEGLLGRAVRLTPEEMRRFTDFILQVTYPPNPIRALDDSLTPDQAAGREFFFTRTTDVLLTCNGCHVLDPTANAAAGVAVPGFFGTDGRYSFDDDLQIFKVPHLRNLYQKVGKFGLPEVPQINPGDNGFMGDQVRGFGFLHDGAVDTLFRFHNGKIFNAPQATVSTFGTPEVPFLIDNDGFAAGPAGDPERRQMEQFMLAFDSNLAPIVGQQITAAAPVAAVAARLDLLAARADAGECDLVVKGRVEGRARGFLYAGGGTFVSDRAADAAVGGAALRTAASVPGQELTYTCGPPGSGRRLGLDRDGDGFGDGDEEDAGSDPADATSVAPAIAALCATTTPIAFRQARFVDGRGTLAIRAELPLASYDAATVSVLARDTEGTIVAAHVPGSAVVRHGRGFRFTSRAAGIARVTLRSSRGGLLVTLSTRRAWPPSRADESAAATEVVINVGGHCFRGAATFVR